MKETLASRILRYSVYGFIAVAIGLAVLGLGFTTNIYPLFYNGTSEMYEFYKNVQILNKAMFNTAVVLVVLSFLMIGFDLNKKQHGLFGTIYAVIVAGYTVMNTSAILQSIPYFSGIYHAFDFTEVQDYTPSYWVFGFAQFMFTLVTVVAVVIALLAIFRFVTTRKNKEAAV